MNNSNNNIFSNNDVPSTSTQNNVLQANQNGIPMQAQTSFNSQVGNTASNNDINVATVNNSINNQSIMQNNQSINNNIPPQQNFSSVGQVNEEELLKAFIGNNYEKITKRSFNFAGFFFTTFYMFYRKMFVYALIVFLINLIVLNVIKIFIVTIVFNVVVGLFVNKIYLYYAKKKIAKITSTSPQKSTEELKYIFSTKGGTSVGKVFLGFFTELGIAIVVLIGMLLVGIGGVISEFLSFDNWSITINDGTSSIKKGTLVEDVSVGGYSCLNSKCNVSIEDSHGNTTDYVLGVSNSELLYKLGDYKDYIKLNIYYTKKGKKKTIVDYKIYLKSNNEDISSVKIENELRDKVGLYSIGSHTDSFILSKIGTTGFGYKDDVSYTYTSYTFVDNKNIEYEMKYIDDNGTLDLVEGNKYTVTFQITEDTFGYEFTIKSVQ